MAVCLFFSYQTSEIHVNVSVAVKFSPDLLHQFYDGKMENLRLQQFSMVSYLYVNRSAVEKSEL